MDCKIKTCVIGSYPIKVNTMEIMREYFNGNLVSWKKYIRKALSDMINAGIDILSDGQTKDPFIQIFTRNLKGCRLRARTEITGKIEYDKPLTVNDQEYVRSLIPKNKKLIGNITGPFTLTKSCIDLYYNNERNLSFDLAYALNQEAKILQKHVDIISIDEPFFSNEMPDYGNELIEIVTKNINSTIRLHVCGDVTGIIPKLIETPVDILSHEFKASPKLLDSFNEYDFPQKICLGSIRSDNSKIESVEEIYEHIKRGVNLFGEKLIQISPDCGQRFLTRSIAFQKLKNLVKAGEKINDR